MEPDEELSWGILMPFVTTVSHGGPHEDQAYTAGWEMGQLDANLNVAKTFRGTIESVVIRRENLPQAELIAMRNRYILTEIPWDEELSEAVVSEWVHVGFTLEEVEV